MNSIDFLETKFKSAFGEDQSKVLADVIIHSYDNLIKIPESNEIKQITLNEIRVLFFGYRVKREAQEFIKDMGGYVISTRGNVL